MYSHRSLQLQLVVLAQAGSLAQRVSVWDVWELLVDHGLHLLIDVLPVPGDNVLDGLFGVPELEHLGGNLLLCSIIECLPLGTGDCDSDGTSVMSGRWWDECGECGERVWQGCGDALSAGASWADSVNFAKSLTSTAGSGKSLSSLNMARLASTSTASTICAVERTNMYISHSV